MFEKDYELRYGDTDINGNIKKSSVMELLQDVSISHANHVGLDSKKLKSVSVACLLAGWRIKFINTINREKKVTVKTGIMKITKCEAFRKYEIWQDGECVVIATAIWFTVNTEKMRVARVVEELFTVFESVTEEGNNLPCEKFVQVENTEFAGKTVVEKRDLDTNNHMNNVKSVEVALNYMPENFEFSEIQVKYRKELKEDEVIEIYRKVCDDSVYFEIKNENNQECVLVYVSR